MHAPSPRAWTSIHSAGILAPPHQKPGPSTSPSGRQELVDSPAYRRDTRYVRESRKSVLLNLSQGESIIMGPRWILTTYSFDVSLHLMSHLLELLTIPCSHSLFRILSPSGHSFVHFSVLLISHDFLEFAHAACWDQPTSSLFGSAKSAKGQ